jgi:hypothetical protein
MVSGAGKQTAAKLIVYFALSSGISVLPSPPWNLTNCHDVPPRSPPLVDEICEGVCLSNVRSRRPSRSFQGISLYHGTVIGCEVHKVRAGRIVLGPSRQPCAPSSV